MQNDMHSLWALFVLLWSYLCTSYPENDCSPFARYTFSSLTGALHEPLQLPTACWGWDWCKTPLRVPQAHQGVSPHVCVPLLKLDTDALEWPMGIAIIAGQLLALPHQAVLHKIFLHPCLPGKKISKSLLYFFSSWTFLWLKSLQILGYWLIWLVVIFLQAVPVCSSSWADWLLEVGVFFYHSLATINDFTCLDLRRDGMDWLQVVIKILKKHLKLGT